MFEVKGKYTDEIVQVYATERKQYDFGERTEFLLFDSERSEYVWVNSAEYEPFNPFEPFEITVKSPEIDAETWKKLKDKLSCASATEFTVPRTTHYPSHSYSNGAITLPTEQELMYEVPEGMTNEGLSDGILQFAQEYGGNVYRHKNGTEYIVDTVAIINIGGKSYWGLNYQEVTNEPLPPTHTRPLFEFLDGRFELVEK